MITSCVIYTRFSPRRNAEESESCETQEAQCLDYAEAKGWTVRAAHRDEGVSGKTIHRAGLSRALTSLKRGNVLLVYRRCRLARGLLVSELVRRQVRAAGARVVALQGNVAGLEDESPEAVFVIQILAAVDELERKLIGERTKAAMRTQQKAGKRVGRYAPYGHQFDPQDSKRLVPHPEEAQVIERILELWGEGLSPFQVARKLDAEMPGTSRGAKWSPRTVAKIVSREG